MIVVMVRPLSPGLLSYANICIDFSFPSNPLPPFFLDWCFYSRFFTVELVRSAMEYGALKEWLWDLMSILSC